MAKVLRNDITGVSIGAYMFHDRKKPCLCIDDGKGHITIYGHFNNIEAADEFMDKLGAHVFASKDGEKQ